MGVGQRSKLRPRIIGLTRALIGKSRPSIDVTAILKDSMKYKFSFSLTRLTSRYDRSSNNELYGFSIIKKNYDIEYEFQKILNHIRHRDISHELSALTFKRTFGFSVIPDGSAEMKIKRNILKN